MLLENAVTLTVAVATTTTITTLHPSIIKNEEEEDSLIVPLLLLVAAVGMVVGAGIFSLPQNMAEVAGARAVLIGYSQGADVLPFAVNRLPAPVKALVVQTVLLGPGERASFEFKMSNWITRDAKGTPVAPELAGFTPASATCIYGTDDRDTICPKLLPEQMTLLPLKGDHHFGGNYDGLAEQILLRSR